MRNLKINTFVEVALGAVILFGLTTIMLCGFDIDTASKLGDAFNIVGTVLSGLALIAAACAVYLQANQLKQSSDAQKNQDRLARLTARLQALPFMIESVNRRIQLIPYDFPQNVFAAETDVLIKDFYRELERAKVLADSSMKQYNELLASGRNEYTDPDTFKVVTSQMLSNAAKQPMFSFLISQLKVRLAYEREIHEIMEELRLVENDLTQPLPPS